MFNRMTHFSNYLLCVILCICSSCALAQSKPINASTSLLLLNETVTEDICDYIIGLQSATVHQPNPGAKNFSIISRPCVVVETLDGIDIKTQATINLPHPFDQRTDVFISVSLGSTLSFDRSESFYYGSPITANNRNYVERFRSTDGGLWEARFSTRIQNGKGRISEIYLIRKELTGEPVVLTDIARIFALGNQTCIALNTGAIKCWGQSVISFDGLTSYGSHFNIPTSMSSIDNAIEIEMNDNHGCALLSNGSIKCWGSNDEGQLGIGSITYSEDPVSVIGIGNATKLFVSPEHTCTLISDGSVKCWGKIFVGHPNGLPQVTFASNVPVSMVGLNTAIDVSTAATSTRENHSCALLSSGFIKCWGDNSYGQLGNGTYTDAQDPVTVSGIDNAVQIVTTIRNSCALISDGSVKCWGNSKNSNIPVSVSSLSNAMSIGAGKNHFCALVLGGLVKCWGKNIDGLLGNGSVNDSAIPVAVSGIDNAAKILVADDYNCALLTDGSVKCWGNNSRGQLGNGTTINSTIPVAVSGITNATSISLDSAYACVVLNDSSAKCWGANTNSQLGDGTTIDSNVPVPVRTP